MKIGLLCPCISECGGVQRMIAILANSLADKHSVSVISINNIRQTSYFELKPEIHQYYYDDFHFDRRKVVYGVIRRIERKYPFVLTSELARRTYFPDDICKRIGMKLEEKEFDCIIAATGHCAVLLGAMKKYLSKTYMIGWMHNSYRVHYEIKGEGFYAQKKFVKEAYKNLDALVTLTRTDAEEYREKMGMECQYIYNPLSFQCGSKSNVKNKKLLFVGRLDTQHKGLDFLIEIMRRLVCERHHQDWTLQIVGGGSAEVDLVQWIRDMHLEGYVELIGEKKDVIPYYCGASVFLCTSRWEGFGLVVTEAMECGLPVVSFCTDGPAEIIEDGKNGYLIENYDLEKFTDAVERLMMDEELRDKFSEKASERAEDFHLDRIIEKWESILKKKDE